jgi:hypothetical protein
VFLALVLGGMLFVVSALDAYAQFLLFALASSFALDLLTPFVATGYVVHEHFFSWLELQASNVGSRAPPTLSIS